MANFEVSACRLDKKVPMIFSWNACWLDNKLHFELDLSFSFCGGLTLFWSSTGRQKLDGSLLTGRRYVRTSSSVVCLHADKALWFIRTLVMQVVKNNLNPIWRPFRISLRSLCGGDVESPIKVLFHFNFHLFFNLFSICIVINIACKTVSLHNPWKMSCKTLWFAPFKLF